MKRSLRAALLVCFGGHLLGLLLDEHRALAQQRIEAPEVLGTEDLQQGVVDLRDMSTGSGGFAQCEDKSRPAGGGVSVNSAGRVSRYDVAGEDDLAGRRFTLKYGASKTLGTFKCTSRQAGVTCTNRARRRGFTLSRGKTKVF